MRRAALLGAAALAMSIAVLCGGCRDQADSPGSPAGDTAQFDQVDSTLASIEADVNQP